MRVIKARSSLFVAGTLCLGSNLALAQEFEGSMFHDTEYGSPADHPQPPPDNSYYREQAERDRQDREDREARVEANFNEFGDYQGGGSSSRGLGWSAPEQQMLQLVLGGILARAFQQQPEKTQPARATKPVAPAPPRPIHFPAPPPSCPDGTIGTSLVENITPEMRPVCQSPAAAVAFYKQACSEHNAVGCERLGYLYRDGDGVKKDFGRAVALFGQSCKAGLAPGCVDLGFMHAEGRGLKVNATQAVELYDRGCRGGDARGCYDLAHHYESGDGVAKDSGRAAELYERACNGGYSDGCNDLGELFQYAAQDFNQAGVLYRRACESGSALGCSNLGWLYESGQGGLPQDARFAVNLYVMGCSHDDPTGCTALGHAHEAGIGVPQDRRRALRLYVRGCDGGNGWACERVKRLKKQVLPPNDAR